VTPRAITHRWVKLPFRKLPTAVLAKTLSKNTKTSGF
jgi:hypothetical protein